MKRTTLLAKMKTFDERSAPVRKPAAAESRPAALLFEPDGAVRRLIAKTLEQDGYRVLESANGLMALELFQCWKSHIHLIVSAAASNDSSTEDSLAQLQSLAGELPTIVVCDARHSQSAGWAGRAESLHRPFSADELSGLVKKITSARTTKIVEAFCA